MLKEKKDTTTLEFEKKVIGYFVRSVMSGFAKETFNLYQSGQTMSAFLYVLLSAVIGISMIFIGMKMTNPTV